MKEIDSDFIIKGFKHGNYYYICKEQKSRYNVYQLFCRTNKDMNAKDIKKVLPSLRFVPDNEMIVSIANEKENAFLLFHNIDIQEMINFRKTLENEKTISP